MSERPPGLGRGIHALASTPTVIVAALVVAILDFAVPLGVAGGVPYVLPVWLACQSRRRRLLTGTVLTSVALICVAYVASPALGVVPSWMVLTNRGLAIFAILVTAGADLWRGPPVEDAGATPLRASFMAPLLTALVVVASIWMSYAEVDTLETEALNERTILDLRAEILTENEVLAMSALLAAATGEARWEARYREHERALEAALERLAALTEPYALAARDQTAAANARLATVEHQSLELAQQGQRVAALALLSGEAYQLDREAYRAGMQGLLESLETRAAVEATARRERTLVRVGAVALGGIGALVVWAILIHAMRRWHEGEQAALAALTEAKDALERSNIDLQQYAYVASHDLQTPLRHISGFVTLLERKHADALDPESKEWMEHIISGTARMEALILDLLSYSQVYASAANFTDVPLREVLDHAVLLLGDSVADANARIQAEELPTVRGDRAQLVQLFQNLVGNGIKYQTGDAPRVHISVREQADSWEIRVQDNGIGINRKYHTRIFSVFRRLHSAHEYPGTGIGLAICRRIVQRHGGQIWVVSEPGDGSAFCFTLPTYRLRPSLVSAPAHGTDWGPGSVPR